MLEIDKAVVDRIKADATMDSYLNPSVSDNRLYSWYPLKDITYTKANPTAIIYRNSIPSSRPYAWSYPSQFPNFHYFFRVLSNSPLATRQVSERLIQLFDTTFITTTHWAVKYIELMTYLDGQNEGGASNPIVSKNVTFLFSLVFSRSS